MKLDGLYLSIRRALGEEDASGALANYVRRRTPLLHRAIELEEQGAQQLLIFIEAYIKQVPKLLLEAWPACCDASFAWLKHSLLTAARLFCGRKQSPNSMLALLARAYMAHRLLEEVNDRFIQYLGYSLLSPDMTRANLVAYELLGEQWAARIDSTVLVVAAQLVDACTEDWPLRDEHTNVLRVESWTPRLCLSEAAGVQLSWRVA